MPEININGAIAQRVFNTPLLIEPSKADLIVSAVLPHVTGSVKPTMVKQEQPDERTAYQIQNGIAIVPILGTLVHRSSFVAAKSGLTSYLGLRNDLVELANNPDVRGIMLDIDSGGGEVAGNFELARLVRTIHEQAKPVVAIANEHSYSAAYSLAASAGYVAVTETGGVGSVGVIMKHHDFSQANQQRGITVTTIKAGDRKAMLDSDAPLTEHARLFAQAEINRIYDIFVAHVAKMRGLSEKEIKDTQAGLFSGTESVKVGFVDAVSTFDNVFFDFEQQLDRGNRMNIFKKAEDKKIEEQPSQPSAEEQATQEPEQATEQEVQEEVEQTPPDQVAASIAQEALNANMGHLIPKLITSCDSVESAKAFIEKQTATKVKDLCELAGYPSEAQEFIGKGLSLEEVRSSLLERMKADSDSSKVSALPTVEDAKVEMEATENVLLDEAKRLVNKGRK